MSTSSRDHPDLGPAQLIEVADRTFAYVQPDGSWWINNTGFVVGDSSIVCIDACSTERRTRAFRETITTVSPAPISSLVNTHHHGDHTYGNSLIGAANIVGHENCRDEILNFGLPANLGIWEPVEWGGDQSRARPTITFADRLTLWSAGSAGRSELTSGRPLTRATTAWSGSRNSGCSTVATCSSTAAPRFC